MVYKINPITKGDNWVLHIYGIRIGYIPLMPSDYKGSYFSFLFKFMLDSNV